MWKGRCSFNHLDSILVGALTAFSHTNLNLIETLFNCKRELLVLLAWCKDKLLRLGQVLLDKSVLNCIATQISRRESIWVPKNIFPELLQKNQVQNRRNRIFIFKIFQYFVLQKLRKFVQNCTKIDYIHI